jgi:hypothetical protein
MRFVAHNRSIVMLGLFLACSCALLAFLLAWARKPNHHGHRLSAQVATLLERDCQDFGPDSTRHAAGDAIAQIGPEETLVEISDNCVLCYAVQIASTPIQQEPTRRTTMGCKNTTDGVEIWRIHLSHPIILQSLQLPSRRTFRCAEAGR